MLRLSLGRLGSRDVKSYRYKKRVIKDITDDFMKYMELAKDPSKDVCGVIAILGDFGSGKTALAYLLAWKWLEIDKTRKLGIFHPIDSVLKYLQNVLGEDRVYAIDKIDDYQYNSVFLIDEGIINLNAKDALTNESKDIEEFAAVIRHKRGHMIITTQQMKFYKAVRGFTNCRIYKRISKMTSAELRKDDPFLREYETIINNLSIDQAFVLSNMKYFNAFGIIYNGVPPFYNEVISRSYRDVRGNVRLLKQEKRMDILKKIAVELLQQGYDAPSGRDKSYYHALWAKIKTEHLDLELKNTEINLIIKMMHMIKQFEPELIYDTAEFVSEGSAAEERMSYHGMGRGKRKPVATQIYEDELELFREFCNGKPSTEFNMNREKVMRIVRTVGNKLLHNLFVKSQWDRSGNEYENKIANLFWNRGDIVIRSLASGNTGGGMRLAPDLIHIVTSTGEIRMVQVKARRRYSEWFVPGTFRAEIRLAEMINMVPGLEGRASAYLYFLPKGEPAEKVLVARIPPEWDTMVVYVNYDKRIIEASPPKSSAKKDSGDETEKEEDEGE